MSDSKLQSLGSLKSKAKQIVANVTKYFLQESKKETSPASYVRRTVEATEVSRTTMFNIQKGHFFHEHEDSFFINLADDSSTDEYCDDYDSSMETASEEGSIVIFNVYK